jgi:hypothetical protein
VDYRGIRYTLRARIEREQWYIAIYPAGVEMKGRVVFGSREEAELQARPDKRLAEKAPHAKSKMKLTVTFLRRTRAAGSGGRSST